MYSINAQQRLASRRTFLASGGVGLGSLALANLLGHDLRADNAKTAAKTDATSHGGLQGLPHFAAKAKRVIFLCMAGGPSHLETFDYKPELAKRERQADA